MKPMCEKLQDALAEHGPRALPVDDPSQAHLRECADCRAFIAALDEVAAALTTMPVHDAPQPVVERLLAATRDDRVDTRVGREAADSRNRSGRSNDMQSLAYPGAVDADGHILEAPDLWEHYLEPRYRERALRLRTDTHGMEYLEINGAPSKVVRGGMLGLLGGMQRNLADVLPAADHTYVGGASFGAMNARERLQRLDQERLEAAFLYPTLGVLWEAECADAEIAQAYTRAYNRWIIDFCADSDGRLIPIDKHLPCSGQTP